MKRLPILAIIASALVIQALVIAALLQLNPLEAETGYWVAKGLDGSYVIGPGRGATGVLYRSFDQYVDDDVLFALNHMSPSGGKIMFTPGDFYLYGLTVAKENLDFGGSGRATRFIGTQQGYDLIIDGYPTVQYATSLHDFWFQGELKFNNSIRAWHYNLYFHWGSPALTVSGNSIWFSNIVFDYAAPAALIAGHSIHFDGGEVYGGGPLTWQGGQGGSLENFVIEGTGTHGLVIEGYTNTMLVQGNYFEVNNRAQQPDKADIYISGPGVSGIQLIGNFFTGEKVAWSIYSTAPYTMVSGGRSYNRPVYLGGYGNIIEGQLAIFPKPTISADTISIAPSQFDAGKIVGGWIKPPAWNKDPDTTGWGLYDMGRMWGRYDLGQLRYWDGIQIKGVQ